MCMSDGVVIVMTRHRGVGGVGVHVVEGVGRVNRVGVCDEVGVVSVGNDSFSVVCDRLFKIWKIQD